MFKITRRKTITRAILLTCSITAVLSLAAHFIINNQQNSIATTQDGSTVNVIKTNDDVLKYGSWQTHNYAVETGGNTYVSYCAQPNKGDPTGEHTVRIMADTNNNRTIKLAIFLREHSSDSRVSFYSNSLFTPIISDTNWGSSVRNRIYAFVHALAGYQYGEHLEGISAEMMAQLLQAITKLNNIIDSNNEPWQMVKYWTLYKTTGGGQDVVWIEQESVKLGSISVKKCDAETDSCTTPQGNATFKDIEIEVYNDSGSSFYNPHTDTIYADGQKVTDGKLDENGKVTFSNLLAENIKYKIVEKKSNGTYELTSPTEKTVTLNTGGQTEEVEFDNTVSKGSITVYKNDSSTGTCTTSSGSLSYSGITFQLINNSTNGVYYNGATIANGQVVDTKTLTAGVCSIVFENLPYGSYIVKETSTAPGYNLNTTTQTVSVPTDTNFHPAINFGNTPILGSITVNKIDSITGVCTTSSTALSYAGITFQIINNTSGNVYYNGNYIAHGDVIDTQTLSANNCSITFSNLPLGSYIIKESATAPGYSLNTNTETVSIPTNDNYNPTISFANTPVLGSLTVNKIDSRTGICATSSAALTYNGITFDLINNTSGTIYYNGNYIANGAVVDTKSLSADSCSVKFENLPSGSYIVKETATTSGYVLNTATQTVNIPTDNNYEPVISFGNTPVLGDITVNKIDSRTGVCATSSGALNYNGVTFQLINNTSGNVYYDGRFIAQGSVIATKTLSATDCNVVFEGLPHGSYIIKETATSYGYNNNTTTKNVTIPSGTDYHPSVTFENQPILGDITLNKIDKETGTCTTVTNKHSFVGTTFQLINNTSGRVYYNGTFISQGAVIMSKTITGNNCSVVFEDLPYGNYQIKETAAGARYALDSEPKSITIPTNNQPDITFTFANQPIRGDVKFVKKDPANNLPLENAYFSISSIDENDHIMETHIVVSNHEGVVDTRSSFALHSFHTNGYDELYDSSEVPMIFSGYGSWFGLNRSGQPIQPVNDNVGALPYGTYIIQELRCDANMFCSDIINEKVTIQINSHHQVVDLGDWNNTCAQFSIETEASDKADNDKYIEAGEKTEIKDHISYCAKKNYTFTIVGTLMDKATGQPLLIDGQKVEKTIEVKPTSDCGTVDMFFPIDSTKLKGKSIVVFEKLYYKGSLKSTHEDINDTKQTVNIVSLETAASDNEDDDEFLLEDSEATIKDTVEYCAVKGKTYTIRGILMDKETNEPLLIDDEEVEQSVKITPEQNCGTTELLFELDTSELAGKSIVVFETLYEKVSETKENKIASHEDIDDEAQTVTVISLGTYAVNEETNGKLFPRDVDIQVKDTVKYCLKPNLQYTLKGVIMDKETGNGILVNSAPVESTVVFTPTETCGEIAVYFNFNTTNLGGAKLVVFESLYLDDELIIEHGDIDDEDQSFEIDITAPETGYATKVAGGSTETTHVELLIITAISTVPIVVYITNHFLSKRKVGFHK